MLNNYKIPLHKTFWGKDEEKAALYAMRNGTLSRQCRRLARPGMVKSSCGKPGFVTCCRSRAFAAVACGVKRDAASCVAAGGCVGSTSTCMDACASPCDSPSGAFLDTPSLF